MWYVVVFRRFINSSDWDTNSHVCVLSCRSGSSDFYFEDYRGSRNIFPKCVCYCWQYNQKSPASLIPARVLSDNVRNGDGRSLMWRLNWNDASYLSLPLRYANSINIPSSGPSQELRRDSTAFRRARSVSWTQLSYSSRLYISMSWFAVSLWLWCLMQAISSISKHIKPLVVTEKSRQWHWKALYSYRWVKDRTYLMISDNIVYYK